MNHVTDIREAGEDASVLTDAGSGGLLGRGVLSEGPLADLLEPDETPRYVLRNKKHGVTVEGTEGTDEYEPDRGHSGVAVVSDVRVLFAAGRSDEDQTVSVSLADVVDVRTEDGLLGGAFVVETVADERYRFPCRGELEPVREYLDAAVGVWTRAQRHVEEAGDRVERLRSAFESGNADVVLASTGEVEETLADAREAADALDGARAAIDERTSDVRADLAALERRAYAEYAEQARERAHVRWDDQDYEAAMDNVDEAEEAYATALTIDADEPADDLLTGRRGTLAEERERLSDAPVDRAEHAVDVATAAGDPAPAVDWWETAVERYETTLSLDWGREDRRFAGDRDELRDDLADAARGLVDAHCENARKQLADGDDVRETDPDRAADAYDRAAEALAAAREVARERVPDAADDVDAVAETLEDRLETLPGHEDPVDAKVDGGRTATASRSSENDDETTSTSVDAAETANPKTSVGPTADDPPTETPTPVDDSDEGVTDEHEPETNSVTDPAGGETDAAAVDETVDAGTEDAGTEDAGTVDASTEDAGTVDASTEDAGTVDASTEDASTEDTETADQVPSTRPGQWRTGEKLEGERTGTADQTREGDVSAESGGDASVGSEHDDGREDEGTDDAHETRVTDPATVDADQLPSLVARAFEAAGWSTTVFGGGTGDRYDLLAGTDGPVSVTVCVWTVHPESHEKLDAATVERYANYFESVDEADAAAICSAAPVSERARARADDVGFELVDESDLTGRLEPLDVDPAEF